MLRVEYTGGDAPQRWLWDPDTVTMTEAEAIEDVMGTATDDTWETFVQQVIDGRTRARRILLWHLLRRTNPDYPLAFTDAPNPKMGQFSVEIGTAEILQLVARVEARGTIDPGRKDALLRRLADEHEQAAAAEATFLSGDVTDDPKGATADGTSPAAEPLPWAPPDQDV